MVTVATITITMDTDRLKSTPEPDAHLRRAIEEFQEDLAGSVFAYFDPGETDFSWKVT